LEQVSNENDNTEETIEAPTIAPPPPPNNQVKEK
jgi:hypothetical protein